MASFYILPPRECLEQATADFLARLVPGLAPPADLLDLILTATVEAHPDTHIVHREDLPADDHAGGLRITFGADANDIVHDVSLAVGGAVPRVRHWAVSDPLASR